MSENLLFGTYADAAFPGARNPFGSSATRNIHLFMHFTEELIKFNEKGHARVLHRIEYHHLLNLIICNYGTVYSAYLFVRS